MKTLFEMINSFAINWPVIWSDLSIYICLWLVVFCIVVVWAANNYRRSVRDEYLVKTTSARIKWDEKMERVKSENRFLHEAFDQYRMEAQNEVYERQERINQLESELIDKQNHIGELELNLTAAIQHLEDAEMRAISSVRRRNPDGTFAKTTGKGHGRKKPAAIQRIGRMNRITEPEPTEPAATAPERDWTTATPDELLAEAKRRYPVGTKVLCNIGGFDNREFIRENELLLDCEYAVSAHGEPWVYLDGKWASILP